MIGYFVSLGLVIVAGGLIYQGARFAGGLVALVAVFVATIQFSINNPKR